MSPHDAEAQALYNQLSLLSDVSASSTDQPVSQGKPGTKTLALVNGEPPHLEFARRYNGCHTDRSRALIIEEWAKKLTHIRYSKNPTLDLNTLDGRLQVARDTRPAKIVAHVYEISPETVYRWRREADKHERRAYALRNNLAA